MRKGAILMEKSTVVLVQKEIHVGDLGNLETNGSGIAHYRRIDNIITSLRMSKLREYNAQSVSPRSLITAHFVGVLNVQRCKLRGMKCNIVGRGLIIHENEDDCGLGNTPDSLTTGNAGKRIACAIIGYAKTK